MTNQNCTSESIRKKIYLEQVKVYTDSLKNQHFEVEHWKMKIEMITNMKDKEIQKRNEQIDEMKILKDKINEKRIENCDYAHTCIKNSWLANLENNFESLTEDKEFEKSNSSISSICHKLETELNEIKNILEGLHLKKRQEKILTEYTNKINNIEKSISIWNDQILKIEKEYQCNREN